MSAKKFILLLGDIALLYVSLFITLNLRYLEKFNFDIWVSHLFPFSLIFFLWILVFFINNLYSVYTASNNVRFYGYLIQNQLINGVLALAFFYFAPSSITSLRPQTVLIILLAVHTVLFLLWRRLFYLLVSSHRLANNVLFIGIGSETIELMEEIMAKPHLGFKPVAIINLDATPIPESLNQIPIKKDLIQLTDYIKSHAIDIVVTTTDPRFSSQIAKYLFDTISLKIRYYNFPDFYESITGKIPVTSLEKNWFLENLSSGKKPVYEFIKRAEDIVLAIILGVVTIPFSLLLIVLIPLESKGATFYKQVRLGKGGKQFNAYKFRSMRSDAESSGQAVWAQKKDPRVTRIGRFIRASRLDEIPQIFNILVGDMSFVGPRPERPEFVAILGQELPFYNERLLVKPGLTGWAQINYPYGDSVQDALIKLQYELFYIKNRSLALDTSIVLKTINTVLNRSMGQ